MALESYLKGLVGSTSSRVRIVSDNSTSRLLNSAAFDESFSHPLCDAGESSSRHSRTLLQSSRSNNNPNDMSSSSVTMRALEEDYPMTPVPTRSQDERGIRGNPEVSIEGFLERQRCIRQSMSPGVYPQRSPHRRAKSPPPTQPFTL